MCVRNDLPPVDVLISASSPIQLSYMSRAKAISADQFCFFGLIVRQACD